MASNHFVGRQDEIRRLRDVLRGEARAPGNLTVQSLEGPGGIGKTCLFRHVLETIDLTDRHYLRLTINGNDPDATSLVRALARLAESAEAAALRRRPAGAYFPSVARVITAIEAVRAQALKEFEEHHPDDREGRSFLSRCLDRAFEAGKSVNDVSPVTRTYLDVRELECCRRLVGEHLPKMASLRQEAPGPLQRLGLGGSTGLRNAVKQNACQPLADALVADLSALLAGYRRKDWLQPMHRQLKGLRRCFLWLDDYEKLQESLGDFLVGYLLPALRNASFASVVVITGRDQLEATHPAWDQHLKGVLQQRLVLEPLPRHEMDALVESFGVRSPDEKERAWRDTQGFPFYVQLWSEEAASGGRGAVMLKRFHDRTTRWMNDQEKGWLQHALFLDEVNKRSSRGMLGDDQEAAQAFAWFEREGSVRDTGGDKFRVREYLRSRLIDYLRLSDPDRCGELQRKGQLIAQG
jgi:hypothetical protein